MSKLKITERQISMIQERLADLDKKKVLKINEGQYDRLFKGGFNKASKSMSKDLKKSGIKEDDAKSEFNPLEFAQELIVFIKDVINNPRIVPFSAYWSNLNISRKELFLMVKKEGLLTMMVGEGNVKTYKTKKIGFRKGIKELCKKIMENQLTEDGGYPMGAEFDPNAPWNQDDEDGENNGREGLKCKECPLKYVYFNERSDDLMIFEDSNGLYAYSGANTPEEEYTDFMDFDGIIDDKAIYNYVNVLVEEGGMKIQMDPELLGDGQIVKITPELKELLIGWYGHDAKMVDILNRLPESTGASSSGAFVGGMSGGPIQKDTGIAPEEALRNINEDMAINKFIVTYNLEDNGGDTSPFFNEFHEVQEFMNKLEHQGIVTGVKVSKTDDKGAVDKEFTYDFDGQYWKKRQPVSETTSMGGAGGINTGRGGDSIEHDVNAFGSGNFMTAGNKLNKEEAMPIVKRQIGESVESDALTPMIEQAISTVDEHLSYQDFAIAVANVIKDSYGQHIINPFLKTLTASLGPSDNHLGEGHAIEGPKVGQVYTNGNGRARIDKIIDAYSMSVTRWGDMPSKSVNIGQTELDGWTLMEGKKIIKVTESQMKRILSTEKKK